MKNKRKWIAKCVSVFYTNRRKNTRRIFTLYSVLLFLGIYFVLAQFELTGLTALKSGIKVMVNQRTFASERLFSWDTVLDALEHTEKGDILRSITKDNRKSRDKLKVIVLLHSHNDPGYKKTYDEYYFTITRHVLSLAVEKLMKYQDMTFIWTDTCFLDRIWSEKNDNLKANLSHLVKTGRFEISLGAWVSADECVTHYFSYIDQLVEGYSWIRQHFDVFPNVSFNMDQFGTSSTIHYIRRKAGVRHSVYNHIHKGTKVFFRRNRLLEFNLKQSLLDNMDSFVHVEPFDDLGFKGSCGPSAKICSKLALTNTTLSFDESNPRNISSRNFAEQLVSQIRLKSDMYLHNVLFLPVGDDLVYKTSTQWDNQYKNLKQLMNYINSKHEWKIDMQFGTLSQYFRELEVSASKNKLKQFPKVDGDLFPYTRGPKYWSGYFTTRQFVKRLGRELQESVMATEMLMAFSTPNHIKGFNKPKEVKLLISRLIHARRQLGIFQHHDAITGTSETSVIKDYKQMLTLGLRESQEVMAHLIKLVIEHDCESPESHKVHYNNETEACNISVIPTIFRDGPNTLTKQSEILVQQDESQLILYNFFTQPRTELISFTVKHDPSFMLVDSNGQNINYDVQIVDNTSVISFIAQLSPVSVYRYNLVRTGHANNFKNYIKMKQLEYNEEIECENSEMYVKYSTKVGSPKYLCSKINNICTRFEIELIHYTTPSDAYTFANSSVHEILTEVKESRKLSGKSYCAVEFDYEFIRIKFILEQAKGLNGQRLKMDVYDDLSKEFLGEFAVRLKTDIKNKNEFYTDSNGMQLKKRLFRSHLSFSANIYPMTSHAVIEDDVNRLNVFSTEPHGVVSTKPGWLDITIDRVVVAKSDKTVTEFSENTFDNVPTLTHLYFKFETLHEPKDKTRMSDNLIPSLESMLTDDLIQHPVYTFYSESNFKPVLNPISFLNHRIPNELVIANVKTLIGNNFDNNGISLTLFRRFVSPVYLRGQPLLCNPVTLFKWKSRSIRFMFNNDTVSNNSFTFMPFDLQTFLIQ